MERLTNKARYEAGYDLNKCEPEWKVIDRLGQYEDTGLTPEEIMDLAESAKKVQEHFDGVITVGQIIDFFMNFYIAYSDDSRIENAILLTNEEASKYLELKERNTAKPVTEICGACGEKYECPNCGSGLRDTDVFAGHCKWCGQKIKLEE